MDNDKLLTRTQVAKRFGITHRSLLNWRKSEGIPFVKIRRKVYYKLQDILEFENNHRKIEQ